MKSQAKKTANVSSPATKRRVHFIGIGGIGISALARWYLKSGYEVSGSDAVRSELTDELRKDGIKVAIPHKASNLPQKGVFRVIMSAAVSKDNPELKTAEKADFKVMLYAEALGEVSKQYKTIAIAGAHGKSTTTSLLALALVNSGFDPTVIVGTKLKEFGNSNFRKGRVASDKNEYLVIEADEYNRSFLNYSPFAGIITNIDKEHLDIYTKGLSEIKNTFLKYIRNFKENGILVVNADDKNLFSLKNKIEKIAEEKNIEILWYSLSDKKYSSDADKIRYVIKIPGSHNLSNALAAFLLAKEMGANETKILKSISNFRGAWRRMEYKGKLKANNSKLKAYIYDDYAHHPTEIKAALSGLRESFPEKQIICVFEPHQAQRLKNLFKEFSSCFGDADALILLDIYKVKGRENKKEEVNSQKLAFAVGARLGVKGSALKQVDYLPSSPKIVSEIKRIIAGVIKENNKETIIVMMGAGNIYKLTPKLLKAKSY